MAVITISRQLGSLGTEIAHRVAEALNYEYGDKEMIGRIIGGYGLTPFELDKFDEKKPHFWESISVQSRKFFHSIQAAIYDLARKGRVVIVGRGGQVVLKDLPGALHVRIFASPNVRLQRLIERKGLDEKQASRLIRQSDEDSSGYIHSFFSADWEDPSLYHLLLNTDKVSIDTGVKLIIEAVHAPEIREGAEKASEKLADLALVRKVEAKLVDVIGIRASRLDIRAEKGVVFLRGEVASPYDVEYCERVVAGLEGVKRVENELIPVPFYVPGL